MRIFYASDKTPNAEFVSNIWRNNLLLPLLDLGHDVVEFDYDLQETFRHLDTKNPKHLAFIKMNRPKVSEALLQQINKAHAQKKIDLFFSYFYDACITPETIETIKALGITTVNWFCNAAHQFYLVTEISPHYDWCLVPEKFRLADYERIGARPIYSQEAANPTIYKHYDVPYEFDVTFVGQAYGERPRYLHTLWKAGIDVRVWGPNWFEHVEQPLNLSSFFSKQGMRRLREKTGFKKSYRLPREQVGGLLSDSDLIKMYSRSKINCGFSGVVHRGESGERIVQIRLRDFEVPMSGGFYMIEYMEELEEFFAIDKEIVCYKNERDLVDKVKYYLTHEEKREAIRQAGHERCLRDHTWQKRFAAAFEKMGLIR